MKELHFLVEECEKMFDSSTGRLREEFRYVRCPVCDGSKFSPRFNLRGFNYMNCCSCGFVFVNPRPSDHLLKDFYNSPFYSSFSIVVEIPRILSGEPYYSTSLSLQDYASAADVLNPLDKSYKVLDVGCGTGSFLQYLNDKLGFTNLLGIEYGENQVSFAQKHRNFPVRVASLDRLYKEGLSFDIVTLIEVIEHVNNLHGILQSITKVLKPGGYLLMTTPNVGTLAFLMNGEFGTFFNAPNHLNYFSDSTLSRLVARYGFVTERIFLDQNKYATLSPKTHIYFRKNSREWRSAGSMYDDVDLTVIIPASLRKEGNEAVIRYLRSEDVQREIQAKIPELKPKETINSSENRKHARPFWKRAAKEVLHKVNDLLRLFDRPSHLVALYRLKG